jgi:hypothetical protein
LQKPKTEQTAMLAAKEIKAREAEQAMKEYQAERLAVQLRTERLRAARLAKEASAAISTKSGERVRGNS